MRLRPAPLLLAALLAACGGGGAAPVTGGDPGATPMTPPPPPPASSTATVEGVDDAFLPTEVTIAAGGTVTWRMVDEEHDVQWRDAAPTGGNIGKIDRGRSASRTFAQPGSYAYSCERHKHRHGGTVTVTGGPPPPPAQPPAAGATVTTPGESFAPATVSVAAGGTVTWQFTGVARHNVTFTGAQPPGGNVPDTDVGGTAQRRFPTVGSYPYTCTRHAGMNGQVVVHP